MSSISEDTLPSPDVLRHVVDVHCHPTDAPAGISSESMQRLAISICAMSTMESDQQKVKELGTLYPDKVVPCFGYHPWFSHLVSLGTSSNTASSSSKESHYRSLFRPTSAPTDINSNPTSRHDNHDKEKEEDLEADFQILLAALPEPRPLTSLLSELRDNLTAFPNAMVGEVGVDRVFRVPIDYFASPRILTNFTIPLEHQLAIFEAQVELAVELGRNVSVHSVKSQMVTVDLLAKMRTKHGGKWDRISVDLHSCGLSPQTWHEIEKKHPNVFLSLSTVINHKHNNHRPLIAQCSSDRILAESDYNDINMCTSQTWDIIKIIAEVKGWQVENEWVDDESLQEAEWGAVRRLEKNWHRFKKGHHTPPKRKKKVVEYVADSDVEP